MQTPGVPYSLRINSQPELKLSTGDFLFVNVVKRLTDDKWAISIGGKLYPAVSTTTLIPGEKLKVFVEKAGKNVILKIINIQKKSPVGTAEFLCEKTDFTTGNIVNALIKSNLSIAPETISYFKSLVRKYKKSDLTFIRSLVVLFSKNIVLESDSSVIQQFLDLLHYEDLKKEKQTKEKTKQPSVMDEGENSFYRERIKKELRQQVQALSGKQHLLQLFNHLHGKHPTWLVIPYELQQSDFSCHGTIKILYEPFQCKILKFLIGINDEKGQLWSFNLYLQKEHLLMKIFTDRQINTESIDNKKKALAIKVEQYHVKIDDNIHSLHENDSFEFETDNTFKQDQTFGEGIDITL